MLGGTSIVRAQGAYPAAEPLPKAATRQLQVETIAQGLAHPWSLAFLPSGKFLVTEREGRMRIVDQQGRPGEPLGGLPEIAVGGQGGLLDVILDKDFAANRRLYFCYSEPSKDDRFLNSTALASAIYPPKSASLQNVKVLFSQRPKVDSKLHFGCRIAQDSSDGNLLLTLGERNNRRDEAQQLNSHLGKIVRINTNGGSAAGNPFERRARALPEIWSWGHRNPQSLAFAPDGRLWSIEHGPQGGDELNWIQPGRNYGWPVVTYGENYGGGKIGEGTNKEGMEPPVHYWVPSIAPSGMAFLTSDRYGPEWKGSLFVGSLKFTRLHRLQLQGNKVVADEFMLREQGQRIRDVRQGPDGFLYLLTDSSDGKILRVKP